MINNPKSGKVCLDSQSEKIQSITAGNPGSRCQKEQSIVAGSQRMLSTIPGRAYIHRGLRGCRPSWHGGPGSQSQSGSVRHCGEGMAAGPCCRGSSHPVDQETAKALEPGMSSKLLPLVTYCFQLLEVLESPQTIPPSQEQMSKM